MLGIFKKFIHSFINNPAIWFFYAFLATSTLSIRKVLFFYPIEGSFNEYTGIYIYLSDIFLFLTIIAWLFILCNKYITLSIFNSLLLAFKRKCSTWNILSNSNITKNVPRGTFLWLKKTYQQVVHNYIIFFPLILVIFSFASILWSNNHLISLFRSIKILEFVMLYFFILYNVSRLPRSREMFHVEHFSCFWGGTFLKRSFQIIITMSIIQSVIGIFQFVIQHSLGLLWLKESILSPQISGVAKIIFDGHSYIRAYGLFPHPNILGGFLVLSIISTLLYIKLSHNNTSQCSTPAPYNVPRGTFVLGWNNLFKNNVVQIVPRGTIILKFGTLMNLLLLIQGLTLLLTFSKSAIFGLIIAFIYIFIKKISFTAPGHVPRGTFGIWVSIMKMFHVEHFYRKLFLFLSIAVLFFFILKPDTYSLLFKSLSEREFYLNVSRGTFLLNPFIGIGAGQFVFAMQNIPDLEQWQFQPVHNVFLLIVNEYGLFVLCGFLFFIFKLFFMRITKIKCSTWNILSENNEMKNVPRGTFIEKFNATTNIYLKSILLAFIFIMIFDHYFWDIQQGSILLWLVLGTIAASASITRNKSCYDSIDKR